MSFLLNMFLTASLFSVPIVNSEVLPQAPASFSSDNIEEVYTPPTRKVYTNGENDLYEDDSTHEKSVIINPPNYLDVNSYHTHMDAMLYQKGYGDHDMDVRHFSLYTEAFVDITINADFPDYTFQIEKVESTIHESLSMVLDDIYDNSWNQNIKSYSGKLLAGDYVIFLFSTYDDKVQSNNYSMDFYVENTPNHPNLKIEELINNKEMLGSVWVSDLVPGGFEVFSKNMRQYRLICKNEKNKKIYDHRNQLFLDLYDRLSGKNIKFCEFYIWDSNLRYTLSNILKEIESELRHKAIEGEKNNSYHIEKISIERVNNLNAFRAVILMANNCNLIVNLKIPYKIIEAIGVEIINSYFDSLVPKQGTEYSPYEGWMKDLYEILELDIKKNKNEITFEDIKNYPRETVVIPYYYKLSTRPEDSEKVIDFSYNLESKNENNRYFFGDKIMANNEDKYNRGQVYGIKKSTDVKNIRKLPLIIPKNDMIPSDILADLNQEYFLNCEDGGYIWFKFTAPKAQKYYFLAQTGDIFIELFDRKITGSYNDGLIASYNSGYKNGTKNGCYFDYYLNQNQVIFIRVRYLGYKEIINGSFKISDESMEGDIHVHRFEEYQFIDGNRHRAICKCGYTKIEGHYVESGQNRCVYCHGLANKGFDRPEY